MPPIKQKSLENQQNGKQKGYFYRLSHDLLATAFSNTCGHDLYLADKSNHNI